MKRARTPHTLPMKASMAPHLEGRIILRSILRNFPFIHSFAHNSAHLVACMPAIRQEICAQ
ncbi:hypothetical protein C7402_102544 [Paraburkholderia unamae]|uniref:Uncharacterized protein n=1 Tax=Paraburkholderia unamae TaxID=219649 RepID=A0ABX5KY20_9BURK|nr:hypothetical protein C7402_102544 [Paraburkholderia unamae]